MRVDETILATSADDGILDMTRQFFISLVAFINIGIYANHCNVSNSRNISASLLINSYEASLLSSLSYLDWNSAHSLSSINFEINVTDSAETLRYVNSISKKVDLNFFKNAINLISNGFSSSVGSIESTMPSERIHIRWFLDGWRHGIWHDTDVMIADNDDNKIFISFRGTDSYADIITGLQLLESVSNSNYFKRCVEGSIHRGIMSAYTDVNQGYIIPINISHINNTSTDQYSYDYELHRLYSKECSAQRDSTRNHQIYTNRSLYYIKNVNLAHSLVHTIISAISLNKTVILSGHSLGGGLASMLILDILINFYNTSLSTSNPHASNSSYFPQAILGDKLLTHLFAYTFGEPEVADETFFLHIFHLYPFIRTFYESNYFKFVSLSCYPHCRPDIVTSLSQHLPSFIYGPKIKHPNQKKTQVDNTYNPPQTDNKTETKSVALGGENDDKSLLNHSPPQNGEMTSLRPRVLGIYRNLLLFKWLRFSSNLKDNTQNNIGAESPCSGGGVDSCLSHDSGTSTSTSTSFEDGMKEGSEEDMAMEDIVTEIDGRLDEAGRGYEAINNRYSLYVCSELANSTIIAHNMKHYHLGIHKKIAELDPKLINNNIFALSGGKVSITNNFLRDFGDSVSKSKLVKTSTSILRGMLSPVLRQVHLVENIIKTTVTRFVPISAVKEAIDLALNRSATFRNIMNCFRDSSIYSNYSSEIYHISICNNVPQHILNELDLI